MKGVTVRNLKNASLVAIGILSVAALVTAGVVIKLEGWMNLLLHRGPYGQEL